jgi:2Fe-2S ferredoxin
MVKLIFELSDGTEKEVEAEDGVSILQVARQNFIDLEGACEGSLACSTCHVILEKEAYDKLPPPEDPEEDMLDLAFGLTPTSRLGCQVIVTEDLNGSRLRIP